MMLKTYEGVTVEYDSDANAWYIDLNPDVRDRRTLWDGREAHFDYSPNGTIVGIEVL
jgi:uncharacterized protein YuzE